MTRLIMLEPEAPGEVWQPFAGARPIAELRAGAWRIRDRWSAMLGVDDVTIMGDHCADFVDVGAAPVVPKGPVQGPAVVARSDFAPAGSRPELDPALWSAQARSTQLVHEGVTIGWIVREGEIWTAPYHEGEAQAIEGMFLRGAYDIITALEHLLPADCNDCLTHIGDPVPDGCIVIGDATEVVCLGAEVEPGVIFDVRNGPVVLDEGVQARAGARLEGPLFAAPGSILLGGTIRHSVIGPACRVHGEVATTVFLGYANKSHDGFIGHSVVGQWVNLGAGTITSNLKNTYGEVRLDLPGGRVPTGRMNLGTLFGDHVKTAIGTLLSTGSVVGAGANLVSEGVPRWVEPFAWGGPGEERLDVEGFIRIVKRVLPRRNVEVTPAMEQSLRAIHARLAG
ncbi:MAG TPA: hypothetical protein VFN96_00795 [Gemmatimonadales bacterium]|nr:hypothetical protein [Gemmatimonadales bacterium]